MRRRLNKAQLDLLIRLQNQHQQKRTQQKETIQSRQIMVEGLIKGKLMGRDEKGKRINLKIIPHGWKWRIGITRETPDKNTKITDKTKVPKTTIWVETDIYHGVRMLQHMLETHSVELDDNDELLSRINPMHAKLAGSGSKSDTLLASYVREISAIDEELSQKTSSHKQKGKAKLEKIPEKLNQAINQPARRGIHIGAATTKIPAFKRRYVEKRESEILGIDSYDEARECFLRMVRDDGLHELFNLLSAKLDENPIGVSKSIAADWEIIARLRVAQELIKKGDMDEALNQLTLCEKAAKVEWIQRGLSRVKNVFEAMRKTKFNGWRAQARVMMEDYARFIGQNNPKYVLLELQQSKEDYLAPFSKHVAEGNEWIRRSLAQKHYYIQKKYAKFAARSFRRAVINLVLA
jgi:hypothetical protein